MSSVFNSEMFGTLVSVHDRNDKAAATMHLCVFAGRDHAYRATHFIDMMANWKNIKFPDPVFVTELIDIEHE